MENKDYLTEISYISQCYNDLMPNHLSFIAAINNYEPIDYNQPFTYCELGCGCGKTTNIVAASYPKSQCVGIDINEEHIKIANIDAKPLKNMQFFAKSFDDAMNLNIPEFDYIVMHGVWSWVGDSVRKDIIKFVKKFLKPKGIFYISYNTMPGWSAVAPIRKILTQHAQKIDGTIADKARHALNHLVFLKENYAPIFQNNSYINSFINMLLESDFRYVVHEFFNDYWRPEYFIDVAETMYENGLKFMGNNNGLLNFSVLVPERFHDLLNAKTSRVDFESEKSIIMNEMFRKDLYVKNSISRAKSNNVSKYLELFTLSTAAPLDEIKYKFSTQDSELIMDETLYKPIFEALYNNQMNIQELHEQFFSNENMDALSEKLINAICTDQINIISKKYHPTNHLSDAKKISIVSKYNKQQCWLYDSPINNVIYFASDVIGQAICVNRMDALFLKHFDQYGIQKDRIIEETSKVIQKDLSKDNIFGFGVDQNIPHELDGKYQYILDYIIPNLIKYGVLVSE